MTALVLIYYGLGLVAFAALAAGIEWVCSLWEQWNEPLEEQS